MENVLDRLPSAAPLPEDSLSRNKQVIQQGLNEDAEHRLSVHLTSCMYTVIFLVIYVLIKSRSVNLIAQLWRPETFANIAKMLS